jgi:hypothetical protein
MLLFMCFPRLVQILPVYLRLLGEGGQYAKNSGAATPEALLRGTRFVILKKRGEDYERKILRVPARRQRERDRHENGALGADFLKIGFENVKQALSVRRPRFYPQRAGDTGRAGRRAGRPCPGRMPPLHLLCDDGALLSGLQPLFDGMPHEADERLAVHPFGAFRIVPEDQTLD